MSSARVNALPGKDKIDAFMQRFQSALSHCVQKGFLVDDCFALIWKETLEEIGLANPYRPTVYRELWNWAREQLQNHQG